MVQWRTFKAWFVIITAMAFLTHCSSNSSSKYQKNNKKKPITGQTTLAKSPAKEVICLVYHRFGNDDYPSTNIDTGLFRKHLNYLNNNDYSVLTLGKAVAKLQKGNLKKGKYAVITVDDGYKTFKTGAMPILKRFGYKATLFVNTESVGGNQYLDWETLKSLQGQGIEIANHSHSHAHFLNKADQNGFKNYFRKDLRKAQAEIKDHLGIEPALYAYPYGEFNPTMKKLLKEEGFKAAVTQNSGVLNQNSDFYAIPRFPMAAKYAKMKSFREKVKMSALPVKDEKPDYTIVREDPPKLILTFPRQSSLALDNIQCFVSGKAQCKIEKRLNADPPEIQFKSKQVFESRRVKYTITAPGKNGKQWFWHSKLWVKPSIGEYE